ncbi:glycerol-3-phosphate dehydrogenase/oxidase [Stagnihabitans tardus]|uniref:FAD-dependent oxidoreductase n=1 Tax=Stagnihabitans tardus TaxID=2699202 RepID=A0AAE4YB25_9RHOB|nr:glycerol-3-phosphate dehydrogenase/oxidase [Stagnihabitans tardus]NBZ89397.1 FAD-dependent oxidoreductase [Stagnihabitans tardus]
MHTRDAAIRRLRALSDAASPILIVGGGINGIGLLRDLARMGIPAVLVEKGDFASGTSAASSRLIHGGLRYLETGEFALVRESVIERNALLKNAAHLVRPQPVLVPAYSLFGGLFAAALRFMKLKKTPGPKGIVPIKIGLSFFDRFGRGNGTMPGHRLHAGRKRMPGLSRKVKAMAEYYDTRLVHPEWLALELIEDAEADCPETLAVNHVEVTATEGGKVTLTDRLGGGTFHLAPRLVINCAGVWVDKVNAALGLSTAYMGGTLGSHLVLDRPDLVSELKGAMLYFETADYRACLIYAIDARHILMGTTDIRASDPENAVCSEAEIDYIFKVTEELLPGAKFRREDISYTYAGIRPLPASGSAVTGAISRDHSFHHLPPEGARPFDMLVLVGGKWTTFRACAEQLGDRVLKILGQSRSVSTLDLAIGGGRGMTEPGAAERLCAALQAEGHAPDTALCLVDRYGSRATEVAGTVLRDPVWISGTAYTRGEIRWLAEVGRIARLQDMVMRRTRLPFDGALTRQALAEIAAICGEVLGWDAARQASEVEEVAALLRARHLTLVP